ncbi:Rv3654c family TadE-like protein [Corynebacterium sp. Q4381]|uniref:Rv3654c family TadE-like protein n=1 Tax=Corynebacterium sp. Marseille-Q4381 TaxID=3121597 RepID=UPI002FE6BDFF
MSAVTAAGIVSAVTALAVSVAGIGAHVADSHRAQVAAELAAVAGAQAYYAGFEPCEVARRTAELNSAVLQSCTLADGHLTTSTSARTGSGQARAGPA